MRALVQRVSWARVKVDDAVVGEIDAGLLVLLGVGPEDDRDIAWALADKVVELRIFEDHQGKTNLSVSQVGGACLVVSQFTLYADCRKGRRPFFGGAMAPEPAQVLCQAFVERIREQGMRAETGRFGASMQVESCNQGPVTIWLDSDELWPR